MPLDLDALRPGHNLSAAAASLAPAALWWAPMLTASTSSGALAPAGLTAAALVATAVANRALPVWPTRAALFIPITALPMSPPAAHAVLALATGALS